MYEELADMGMPHLINYGTCNLHVVQNGFGKALAVYGHEVEDFTIDMFYWFKQSACRREDLASVQEELGIAQQQFLRHVNCRWLTLEPAINRIIDRWETLKEYIMTLQTTNKACEKSARYKRIRRLIQDPAFMMQLHFLRAACPLFSKFLTLFQSEGPLVHILHESLTDVLRSTMLRFMKANVVVDKKGKDLFSIDVKKTDNHLSHKDIDVGHVVRQKLHLLKSDNQKKIVMDMRSLSFYITACEYLQSHLPLDNTLLQHLSCLHPRIREARASERRIKSVAKHLPSVDNDHEVMNRLADEWKMYIVQDIPEDWFVKEVTPETTVYHRVDHCWTKVLETKDAQGRAKYNSLSKVVKMALCLPHENADVERSLSAKKKTLTPERVSLNPSSR